MERINLFHHETPLVLRNTLESDIPQLSRLQVACFPGMQNTDDEAFRNQIRVFPEGQFCIESRGEIIASCSAMIVDFDDEDEIEEYDSITSDGYISKHNQYGDTLYGIEIMVDPRYRGMKLARRLYEARKQLVREKNLKRIIVGGRIPGYAKHAHEMSVREYVELVSSRSLLDPVLTAQLANGFTISRLISSYLEDDKDSAGHATLLEWVNLDYEITPRRARRRPQRARVCAVQFHVRQVRDLSAFERQCEYFASSASDMKCDFLVFPESFSTELLSLFSSADPARAIRKLALHTPQLLSTMSKLAVRYDVNIIGGSLFTLEGEDLFNVAFLFRRDGTIDKQYKLRISPSEQRWWGVQA
ncbi:MAG: GNAT family N-acetyltransferase, partial [Bdellovibrionales bacterium]|nr:GNAT family N-acetyltransferase [Bdellovibrionales bacterium]